MKSNRGERGAVRLTRRFALGSALVVLIAGVALAYFHRASAVERLERMAERNNVTLTHVFANVVWPKFAGFAIAAHDMTAEQIRRHPKTAELHGAMAQITAGTPVLKVKIYDITGNTVFSTAPRQIGVDYSANPRFEKALRDQSATKLEFRETFGSITGPVRNRYVLSSYIALRTSPGMPAEGVVEIYRDVTEFYTEIIRHGAIEIAAVAATLLGVFALLLLMVWQADRQIQSHHRRALDLAKNVARVEAASREKSNFVANISHELRTPLNAILGFAQVLKDPAIGGQDEQARQEYVDNIYDSGKVLLNIINDVLDMAKVEAGKMTLSTELTDVREIAMRAIVMVQQNAPEKALSFDLKHDPDTPIIETDAGKLRQILLNLLSNAAKFTPEGGSVEISVGPARTIQGIDIVVSDTGIGISPQDIPVALSTFGQVDSSLSRRYDGTGLGLPLARKLTELIGGTITLESKAGEGTTVTVALPTDTPNTADNETEAAEKLRSVV